MVHVWTLATKWTCHKSMYHVCFQETAKINYSDHMLPDAPQIQGLGQIHYMKWLDSTTVTYQPPSHNISKELVNVTRHVV